MHQLRFAPFKTKKKTHAWKFFSFHPGFLPRNLNNTSHSQFCASLSSHVPNSSKLASRTFQLPSPNSAAIFGGTKSAARASASSGLNLYLNVSDATAGAAAALPLEAAGAAAGGSFLATGGVNAGAGVEGLAVGDSPAAAGAFLA